MKLRAFLYKKGIFRQHRLPALVISIGNLTMGGTGKTPMIQYVARFFLKYGRRPAIISRGYGSRAQSQINIVSDGKNIMLDAEIGGDEPRMLAETLHGVPVITGKKRSLTANYAIRHLGADSILLDDGFQHLGVERDLDLVLFNADSLLENRWVLPGGELREPLSALRRAHSFIITGVHASNLGKVNAFRKYLEKQFPERPVFTGTHKTAQFLVKWEKNVLSTIHKKEATKLPLIAFCGIAHPDSFRQTLTQENFNILGFRAFQDHHFYSARDMQKLFRQAQEVHAQGLITTEKDFVKVKSYFFSPLPILSLKVEFVFGKEFKQFLEDQIKNIKKKNKLFN